MSELFSDIRIQELLLILLLSLMLAILTAGIVIKKIRPFGREPDSAIDRKIGGIMVYLGSILGGTALLILILSLIEH